MRTRSRMVTSGQAIALGATALAGVCLSAGNARAAAQTYAITINSTARTDSSKCTLRGAIEAINTKKAVGKCQAGGGSASSPDIILINGGLVFSLSSQLDIKSSMILRSTSTSSMVVFKQSGSPLILVNAVTFPSAGTSKITFEDIDFEGTLPGSTLGIYAEGKDPDSITFNRCWIQGFGFGGIHSKDTSLIINSSGVNKNSHSESTGAGVFIEGNNGNTTISIFNSSITNNFDASGACNGGGVFLELNGAIASIVNSTISDNKGGSGLALYNPESNMSANTLKITGSTIYGNSTLNAGCSTGAGVDNPCVLDGSGVCHYFNVTLDGTVIDANSGDFGETSEYTGPVTIKDSLLGSSDNATVTFVGSHNVTDFQTSGLDPVLRDNGVTGQKRRQTHKPLAGSLCINFLPSIDFGSQVSNKDERGRTRGALGGFDVGAVELQSGE